MFSHKFALCLGNFEVLNSEVLRSMIKPTRISNAWFYYSRTYKIYYSNTITQFTFYFLTKIEFFTFLVNALVNSKNQRQNAGIGGQFGTVQFGLGHNSCATESIRRRGESALGSKEWQQRMGRIDGCTQRSRQ